MVVAELPASWNVLSSADVSESDADEPLSPEFRLKLPSSTVVTELLVPADDSVSVLLPKSEIDPLMTQPSSFRLNAVSLEFSTVSLVSRSSAGDTNEPSSSAEPM